MKLTDKQLHWLRWALKTELAWSLNGLLGDGENENKKDVHKAKEILAKVETELEKRGFGPLARA